MSDPSPFGPNSYERKLADLDLIEQTKEVRLGIADYIKNEVMPDAGEMIAPRFFAALFKDKKAFEQFNENNPDIFQQVKDKKIDLNLTGDKVAPLFKQACLEAAAEKRVVERKKPKSRLLRAARDGLIFFGAVGGAVDVGAGIGAAVKHNQYREVRTARDTHLAKAEQAASYDERESHKEAAASNLETMNVMRDEQAFLLKWLAGLGVGTMLGLVTALGVQRKVRSNEQKERDFVAERGETQRADRGEYEQMAGDVSNYAPLAPLMYVLERSFQDQAVDKGFIRVPTAGYAV